MPDPFFEQIRDGEWNACIGVQGDELNYVDGFLEAARILASAVIEQSLTGSRDSLAMPILYNARHGLELALKYVARALANLEMARPVERTNHDILAYWSHLRDANVADFEARELIKSLEPFVKSLDQIDDDGQELRYFETRDGDRSLGDLAVVNLPLIRASIEEMGGVLHNLTDRIERLSRERITGTHTNECSRTDLREIALLLGNRATWTEADFDRRKRELVSRFELSNKAFGRAIEAIERSRELAALIGIETPLTYLSDDKAITVATKWIEAHPDPAGGGGLRVVDPSRITIEEIEKHHNAAVALDDAVIDELGLEEFADLQVVFYIGRDAKFGEEYDRDLKRTIAEHGRQHNRRIIVHHILSKTNLLDGLIRGARRVGRPSLAEQLSALPKE